MPSVRNLKKKNPFIWKKPIYYPKYKILITRSDGTVDDITQNIFEGELLDGVTTTVGNFKFTVDNSSQALTDAWTGNEIIKVYMDYAKEATTLRFRGRIEQVSYRDYRIVVKGRGEGKKLLEVTVTQSYSSQTTSDILTDLIETYASDFTTTNIIESTTVLTANWYQKPLLECIQELCNASGYDFYVDNVLDCHYFESGSIINGTEAIVHNSNLFKVGDFARDYSQVKNRVIVYGGKQEGMDIISTSEDTDSQDSLGIKELIINDNSITTDTQAKERSDYELSTHINPPLVGDIESIGLPTLQPGERIMISAPTSNIPPTNYKVINYEHRFGYGMETKVRVEKEQITIDGLIKDRIGQNQQLYNMPNPNEMRNSWINTFDLDSGAHSSTEIVNGVLKTDGSASGTWISSGKEILSIVTECEFRANGSTLSGTLYYVSVDNGITWQSTTLNSKLILSPPGQNLKLKIGLNSATTQINSINLLYKN